MKLKVQENNWQRQLKKWEINKNFIKLTNVCVLIFILTLCINIICAHAEESDNVSDDISETAENTEYGAELLILIDNSGSMEPKDGRHHYGTMAVKWAQDICALIADNNISLSVAAFDFKCSTIINSEKVTLKNCREICEKLNDIEFGGDFTDQYNAINSASTGIQDGKTKHKFIVMISDGDLDLDKNKKIETEEEKTKKENFKSWCKEYGAKEDYTIILVGLGEDNIDLFENIENTNYYNNEVDLKKIKNILFNNMSIQQTPIDMKDNSFDVDKESERCIICIEYFQDNMDFSDKEIQRKDFKLFFTDKHEGNRQELLEVPMFSTPMVSYLYIDDPKEGKYDLDFPYGRIVWIECIKKDIIESVILKLIDEEEKDYAGEKKEEFTFYSFDEHYLKTEINIFVGVYPDIPLGATAKFYIKEISDLNSNFGCNIEDADKCFDLENIRYEKNAWTKSLNNLEKNKWYDCVAVVSTTMQGECRSNAIRLFLPDTPAQPVSRYLKGDVDTIFDRKEYIDSSVNIDLISITYNDLILWEQGRKKENVSEIEIGENQELSFSKQGEYTIQIKENGELKEEIHFIIEDNGRDICFGKIAVVVVIVVIIIIIIYCCKKRKKSRQY